MHRNAHVDLTRALLSVELAASQAGEEGLQRVFVGVGEEEVEGQVYSAEMVEEVPEELSVFLSKDLEVEGRAIRFFLVCAEDLHDTALKCAFREKIDLFLLIVALPLSLLTSVRCLELLLFFFFHLISFFLSLLFVLNLTKLID